MIHLPLAMILALGVWSPIHAQSAEPAKEKMPMEGMMMEKMMQHMMQHMEMGKESMAKCPMINDM